jgi:hypothetical protein
MWNDSVGVRAAIHQALRSRGIDPVPVDPWYFPTAGQYTAVRVIDHMKRLKVMKRCGQLLVEHGMTPGEIALVPRPTPLTTDLRGWLETFARRSFLSALEEKEADAILDEVQEACRPDAYWNDASPGMGSQKGASGKEGWEIMYVRLRGTARWEGQC